MEARELQRSTLSGLSGRRSAALPNPQGEMLPGLPIHPSLKNKTKKSTKRTHGTNSRISKSKTILGLYLKYNKFVLRSQLYEIELVMLFSGFLLVNTGLSHHTDIKIQYPLNSKNFQHF